MIKFDLFRTPFLGALHRVRKRPPVRRGNPAASAPAPIGQRPARRPPCPGPPCDHSDADLLSVRTRISEPAARAQPGTIRRGVCRTVTRPRIRRSHEGRRACPAETAVRSQAMAAGFAPSCRGSFPAGNLAAAMGL